MPSTRHRLRIGAVVLTSCFALCGCALQSARPAAAAREAGSQGASADVWRYARTITIDTTAAGADVTEDVESYPLAVLLDKSRFDFSQARADGADIRFFDAGGKALPHAIDLWDPESGSAAIWVFLDVIKGNSRDQSIVMKWGHPGAPDIGDSRAVFKRAHGFVGVWHLGEDGNTEPGGYKDSSDHEAHGTGVGMMPGSRVDARIGKGTHVDNPAGQDTARWIRVAGEKARQFNPGPPITVSIWALGYSYPIRSYETIIAKGDTSWTLQRVQYGPGGGAQKIAGQGYQTCVRTPAYHLCAYNFAGQGLVTNEWLHFMVVLEEPAMRLYINGELNASESAGPWNKGDHDLGIATRRSISVAGDNGTAFSTRRASCKSLAAGAGPNSTTRASGRHRRFSGSVKSGRSGDVDRASAAVGEVERIGAVWPFKLRATSAATPGSDPRVLHEALAGSWRTHLQR